MGATKIKQYSTEAIDIAKIAHAIGHPARITILQVLKENVHARNVDFQSILKLTSSSVHNHLRILRSAEIVNFIYCHHEYRVELIPEKLEDLKLFIKD